VVGRRFHGWFLTGDGARCESADLNDAFTAILPHSCALRAHPTYATAAASWSWLSKDYLLPGAIRSDTGSPFAIGWERADLAELSCGVSTRIMRSGSAPGQAVKTEDAITNASDPQVPSAPAPRPPARAAHTPLLTISCAEFNISVRSGRSARTPPASTTRAARALSVRGSRIRTHPRAFERAGCQQRRDQMQVACFYRRA